MKKLSTLAAAFILSATLISAQEKPLIIPTPKLMTAGKWNVEISSAEKPLGQIVLKKKSKLFNAAAEEINKYIVKNGGKALPVTNKETDNGINIILSTDLEKLKDIKIPKNKKISGQAYAIRFQGKNILLAGSGNAGALYAAVTFCHMLKNANGKTVAYNANVDDYPDFEYRGDSALGIVLITRGYLFSPKVLQTQKTYPELVKEYIDICLHLKLNEMVLSPRNLRYKGKDYTSDFIKYAKARGFNTTVGLYAGFFRDKYESKKTNSKKLEAYLKKTGQTKKDFMEHIGRYFAWSNEELIRKLVRDHVVKGASVYYHCPDTGDENWGKRGNKCRKKFGNDRAKADAFVLNTIYDELKKLNPGDKNIKLYAVIQPYHPLYVDPKYYKYYQEYVDHFSKLDKAIPKDIPLCVRECSRESLEKWNKIMPGRPFYLYHEHRQFHGATQLIASNIRNVKTFYFPERSGDIFSFKSGTSHWELDVPLGAEYSWDTEAPGSGLVDMNNRFEFNKDGKLDKDFISITVPKTVRFMWGEKAAPYMEQAYASGLNINLVINPFAAFKSLNRQSYWKSGKLLPELTPEMFKKQEKAAETVCENTLKIMKGEIPVQYDFLKARANRLYKHATAVKLLAPVYVHYFSAGQALKNKENQKAKEEIEKAKELNAKIPSKLKEQEKLVKQYPQVSSSFLSAGLRNQKPFKLLTKKLDEFRIPTEEELKKTSISTEKTKLLQERDIKAEKTAQAPVIDGKLDDPCWKNNKNVVSDFFRYPFTESPKLAYDQTTVKVCYDNKNLYVAIRAFDNDFDSIRSKDVQHDDSSIFSHDIVEVFLNPNPKNLSIAQFVLNASGSSFDSFSRRKNAYKKTSFVKEWNPDWKKATSLDKEGWIAEMAIPFECFMKAPSNEISSPPKAGDIWRAYFSREKRGLEFSGVRFIKDGGFTTTEGYPKLIFLK